MIIEHCQQGSEEWLAARCGRITMSHAKELITKGRSGNQSATRLNYLLDVAAEQLSGKPTERVTTWDMDRGIILEPFALEAYFAESGRLPGIVGLAYLDESRTISASPDGVCGAIGEGGVEIKCPRPRTHMRYIDGGAAQNMAQIQGNMWIFEAEWWDFVSFCPEFEACPLHIERVERDDDMIEKIADSAMCGVMEIRAMVAALKRHEVGGDVRGICKEAISAVDNFVNDGEVQIDE